MREDTSMGNGALTGQWVAVTIHNELREDKKKKEIFHYEYYGKGKRNQPCKKMAIHKSPTFWIFSGHAHSDFYGAHIFFSHLLSA